jgi:hypothetical protein
MIGWVWAIESVETSPIELDFRSSEQGTRRDTSLLADKRRIVNAVGLVDVSAAADRVQVEVCEECGFTHCAPGGWVSLRRFGSRVLWMPAFSSMAAEPSSAEYEPPAYMSKVGLPAFSEEAYAVVRENACGFPSSDKLVHLGSRELLLILQWEAPGKILGKFPEAPRLREDALLAVDRGDLADCREALVGLIHQGWSHPQALVPCSADERTSFFIDHREHPGWSPLLKSEMGWGLSLGPGLDAVLKGSA